jgi:GNAT superfamily N-acetyltransferase
MIAARRATAADATSVADVFLASFAATYPAFPVLHTDAEVRAWIADIVLAHTECWVAVDDDAVVALLSLTPGWIEHLYVAPDRIGLGIGRRLIELAKERSEGRLELWTFQVNERARRFYERNGFAAVDLTDGSGNEERQPDVRYRWVDPLRTPDGP